MPYCPSCGTQNSDTAKFCTSCGAALTVTAAEQKNIPQSSVYSLPVQPIVSGSKVTFDAADGKTYTGTVKEIQGDQYKIKYDAFNFETWLKRDQFTVIAVNTVPPVYPGVPQNISPRQYSNNTSFGGSLIIHPGFWGCILIIIGFFTNWVNVGYTGISALDIMKSATGIMNSPDEEGFGVLILACITVIILSALICLLYILGVGIGRGAFILFKMLPLLALIAFVTYIIIKSQNNPGEFEDNNESGWRILGVGIYLTLAGSFVLAISKSRK